MTRTTNRDIDLLDQMAEDLARLASRLRETGEFRMPSAHNDGSMRSMSPLLPRFLALAKAEYSARRSRESFLPRDFLGEPAWDVLLDLYINQIEGKRISVSSACIAAAVPPTTALRWVSVLEKAGLIEREEDLFDQRRSFLQLSQACFGQMTRHFAERDQAIRFTPLELHERSLITEAIREPAGNGVPDHSS